MNAAASAATRGAGQAHSDALVVFGFTDDLASKQIFPALYQMVKKGTLTVPVIGVASLSLSTEQMQQRVRDSVGHEGKIDDPATLDRLLSLLKYVMGDYKNPETFQALKTALGSVERPARYLAITPSLFGTVIKTLGSAGLAKNARVIIAKPFGRDLASAIELNDVAHFGFAEASIFRIDHSRELRHVPHPGGWAALADGARVQSASSELRKERHDDRATVLGGRERHTGHRHAGMEAVVWRSRPLRRGRLRHDAAKDERSRLRSTGSPHSTQAADEGTRPRPRNGTAQELAASSPVQSTRSKSP